MRNKIRLIKGLFAGWLLAFAFVTLVSSCEKEEGRNASGKEIHLYAGISGSTVSTRGTSSSTSGVVDEGYSGTLSAALFRVDKSGNFDYPSFLSSAALPVEIGQPDASNGYLREMNFSDGNAQFFANSSDPVTFVGIYPWKDGYTLTSGSEQTVTIPIDGATDILYGSPIEGSASSSFPTMEFNHALCQFQIYAYAMAGTSDSAGNSSTASSADEWGAITALSMKGMSDQCKLTLPNSNNSQTFALDYASTATTDFVFNDADNDLYFNPGESLPGGYENASEVGRCLAAPPSDGTINITLKTSKSEEKTVSVAKNFMAGYAYKIYLCFSAHGYVNASVQVSRWQTGENVETGDDHDIMYLDLSRDGTANSYIINSGNYAYSFKATVMGNGVVPPGSSESNLLASTPGYIDILWTDVGDYVKLASNVLSDGRVLFTVGDNLSSTDHKIEKEGNVIIAAYDNNSTSRYLIWTWHLWLAGDTVPEQGYGNGFTVQDRNLGAVSKDGRGLYYKWGRPMPIVQDENGNLLYSKNYLDAHSNEWGYQNDYTDLVKTMYDPCPRGYMVRGDHVWEGIVSVGSFTGSTVDVSLASGGTATFPLSGYYDQNDNIVGSGSEASLWTAVPSSNDKAYGLDISSSGVSISPDDMMSARQLRCVLITDDEYAVTNLSESQTANSYVVSRPGYFKFNVGIRGNGVSSLVPVGGSTAWDIWDSSVGVSINTNDITVRPIWWQGDLSENGWYSESATSSNLESDYIGVSLLSNTPDDEGYITFRVSQFHKGNLILAAFDKSTGEIVWSWHIWLTDKPSDKTNGNYALMDRFLGATYAPDESSLVLLSSDGQRWATYGFYYQWGRKDPFPSSPVGATSEAGSVSSSPWWSYDGSKWTLNNEIRTSARGTVLYASQNPETFMLCANISARGDNYGPEWFYDSAISNGDSNRALWGYAVEPNVKGRSFTKTMHDPCPPGYRTMYHYALYKQNDDGSNYSSGVELNNGESGSYGIILKDIIEGNNKYVYDHVFWPYAGMRWGNSGAYTDVGSYGRVHTGMPNANVFTRSIFYYYGRYGQLSVESKYAAKANGFSVRCQKE